MPILGHSGEYVLSMNDAFYPPMTPCNDVSYKYSLLYAVFLRLHLLEQNIHVDTLLSLEHFEFLAALGQTSLGIEHAPPILQLDGDGHH